MCVCGQRALGLPRLGGVGLCCPPSPRPALWVSVAAHGAEGAGQPLLLCPAPGPREEGEEGGQKGQEDMEERCHRERRERVSLRVWSSWGDEDRGELAPELEVGFWAWGGEGKRHIDISPSNRDSSLCFLQPSVSHDVLCIEVK